MLSQVEYKLTNKNRRLKSETFCKDFFFLILNILIYTKKREEKVSKKLTYPKGTYVLLSLKIKNEL